MAAFVEPKYTTLLVAVALKLEPRMVTLLPTHPLLGKKDVMLGICENKVLLSSKKT